jgi:hypothetical protein
MVDTTTPFPFRVRARAAGDWDVPDLPSALSQLGVTRCEARLNDRGAEDGATAVMTFFVGQTPIPLELRGTPGHVRQRWWVIDTSGAGLNSPESGTYDAAVAFFAMRLLALWGKNPDLRPADRISAQMAEAADEGRLGAALQDLRTAVHDTDEHDDPDPNWVLIRVTTRDTLLAWFDRLAADLGVTTEKRSDPA